MMKNRIIKDFHDVRGGLLRVKLYFLIGERFTAIWRSWLLGDAFVPFDELLVLLMGLERVEDVGLLAQKSVDWGWVGRGLRLIETHLFGAITLIIIIPPINAQLLIFMPEIVFLPFFAIKCIQMQGKLDIHNDTFAKTSRTTQEYDYCIPSISVFDDKCLPHLPPWVVDRIFKETYNIFSPSPCFSRFNFCFSQSLKMRVSQQWQWKGRGSPWNRGKGVADGKIIAGVRKLMVFSR